MNDKKLKRLFDFQKFDQNPSLGFAIQSSRSYIASLSSKFEELSDNELDMVNAAGTPTNGANSTDLHSPKF